MSLYQSAQAWIMLATRVGLDVQDSVPMGVAVEMDAVARLLADSLTKYQDLPDGFDSLEGNDRDWFADAVGLVTAGRLMTAITTGGANGDLVQMRGADGALMQFASGPGERERCAEEAVDALGRISFVRMARSNYAFTPFAVRSPGRYARFIDRRMALGNAVTQAIAAASPYPFGFYADLADGPVCL